MGPGNEAGVLGCMHSQYISSNKQKSGTWGCIYNVCMCTHTKL